VARLEAGADETVATLYINDDFSRCGACGRDADPKETTHLNEQMAQPPGCGARYVTVSTDLDMTPRLRAAIMEMKPNLPFADDPIH